MASYPFMNRNNLEEAARVVRGAFPGARPACGLILGSGMAEAAGIFNVMGKLDYREIPGLGRATVEGHPGCLVWGERAGLEVFVFQGRRHFYEGGGWDPVAVPVYLAKVFGGSALVTTNAAGGIRRDLKRGRLMVIDDHINAMHGNPLAGPHDPFWGERFPDQSALYDPELRSLMDAAAAAAGRTLAHGVYLAVAGPAAETPAETRAFRSWGADAVGMSTVPEAMLAGAAGLRVFGVSCIVNRAADVSSPPFSHGETVRAAGEAVPGLRWVLEIFFSGQVLGVVARRRGT